MSPALASRAPASPRLGHHGRMHRAPTAGAALVLCAATAGLLSAQGRAAPTESPRFASWDEMNVLAHGLLQLGHGLREHVERTREQLDALERRLGACGAACKEPGVSSAPPHAPANLVPRGEAAPETLGSLQVRALLGEGAASGVP